MEARCGRCDKPARIAELVQGPAGGAMVCRECADCARQASTLARFGCWLYAAWKRWRSSSPRPSSRFCVSKPGVIRGHAFAVSLELVRGRWDRGEHRLRVQSPTADDDLVDAVIDVLTRRLRKRGTDWIDDLEFADYWKHLELEASKALKRR